jgi:hypothetical protein
MSARIRGKECRFGLVVDGQEQEGSYLKVKNFSVTPDAPITTTQFTGEPRLDADQDVNGYNISFEIEELDAKAEETLDVIDANQLAGLPPPSCFVTTLKNYRQPGVQPLEHLYSPVTLTCESSVDANGGNYVGSKWKGFSPYRKRL